MEANILLYEIQYELAVPLPICLNKRVSRNQAAAKMIRQYLNLFVNASPVLYIREGAGKICPFFFYFFLNNQDVLLSNCTFE